MGGLSPPEPLTSEHRLDGFDCARASLDDWLIRHARRSERDGGARTYVVVDRELGQVVGYYALAAGSVVRDQAPGVVRRNMPDPIPAAVLGRLAVDHRYRGRGIGAGLLKDAVLRSVGAARHIGAQVLLVHALDEAAAGFYRHHGFVPAMDEALTLMLPLG